MMIARRGVDTEASELPLWARIFLRVLFREGPITIAMLVMLGVILGLIESPYLGKPLEELRIAHERQIVILERMEKTHERNVLVLEDIRDDFRRWQQANYQPRRAQP